MNDNYSSGQGIFVEDNGQGPKSSVDDILRTVIISGTVISLSNKV